MPVPTQVQNIPNVFFIEGAHETKLPKTWEMNRAVPLDSFRSGETISGGSRSGYT